MKNIFKLINFYLEKLFFLIYQGLKGMAVDNFLKASVKAGGDIDSASHKIAFTTLYIQIRNPAFAGSSPASAFEKL